MVRRPVKKISPKKVTKVSARKQDQVKKTQGTIKRKADSVQRVVQPEPILEEYSAPKTTNKQGRILTAEGWKRQQILKR